MSPILGIIASSKAAAAGDYESIATVTVGSGGSSTITFNNIAADWNHLQVRVLTRNSSAGNNNFNMIVNNDTSTNYSWHLLAGNGSATEAYGEGKVRDNCIQIIYSATANQTASVFSAGIIDILDYTNTNKNKTMRSLGGFDNNGSGNIRLVSHCWFSTNAITRLDFTNGSGNFAQYTSIALYGIKGL
jgi:uncharacterized protein affecting Mg2+/Co2+ transport